MKTKILTLGLVFLLMLGSLFPAEKKKEINPWQSLFTEPFESVYFIMKDGTRFRKTNNYEELVYVDIDNLEKELKTSEKNYSIKEIKIVIHNHRWKNHFTRSDYRQYWTLKSYGFDGLFLMYCHRTKKVYNIEEKEKKESNMKYRRQKKERSHHLGSHFADNF
ncbi:hypothetical protein ES705_27414 [subsurface metagenome]